MNPKVDAFLNNVPNWRAELEKLRNILLDSQLTEELKWNVPVYTFKKNNVAGINGLKEFCALAFFNGTLLKDTNGILYQPGKNTQAARWIKFTSVREIAKLEPVLRTYIQEAIEIEMAGLKVEYKKTADFPVPEEFQKKLNGKAALKKAFHALTPGRQRAYLLHFAAPKLSKTREARVEKWEAHILKGKGLNDR